MTLVVPTALVALMLWWHRVERPACRWLALFLLAFCLDTVPQIIGFAGAYQVWPWLTFAPFSYQLFFGPLVYLHAYTLMVKTPLGWRWWLLAPGVVQTLYYIWAFLFLGDYRAKWAYTEAFHEPWIMPIQIGLAVIFALACAVASGRLLRRYRRFLSTTQSVYEELDPSWVWRFLTALSIALIVWVGFEIANQLYGPLSYRSRYPMFVVIAGLLLWMGLAALSRIRTPYIALARLPDPSSAPAERDWAQEGARLRDMVIAKQWHLEPRLSLRDLASRAGTNDTYVSRAINQGLGLNFNTLINEARIGTAKALMQANADARVLDIAQQAGFNSKATFNRVFRALCGMTPTAWRKRVATANVSNSVNS